MPLFALQTCLHSFPHLKYLESCVQSRINNLGTLCASDPLHFEAFKEILVEVGFQDGKPIDEEFFMTRISGRSNPIIAKSLFPAWTEDQHRAFYEDKEERYRQRALAGGLEEMPGLTAFLDWQDRRGLRRVAVTNAPKENVAVMMTSLKLGPRFERIILGDECARPKPFPDPYLEGLAFVGAAADEAIAIEDSPSGLLSAVRAGIPTIGVLSGHDGTALREAGACLLVNDYVALMKVLGISGAQGEQAVPAETAPGVGVAGGKAAVGQ